MNKACLAASGLITYVCAAAVTQLRPENPVGWKSRVKKKKKKKKKNSNNNNTQTIKNKNKKQIKTKNKTHLQVIIITIIIEIELSNEKENKNQAYEELAYTRSVLALRNDSFLDICLRWYNLGAIAVNRLIIGGIYIFIRPFLYKIIEACSFDSHYVDCSNWDMTVIMVLD